MTVVILNRNRYAAGRRAAAIVCLTLAATGSARAEARTGLEAYRNGDFQTALEDFQDDALAGDKRARYNLGVMLFKGTGIQKDVAAALKWHRLSAEQGYAPAQHGLGVMYYRGDGVAEDHAEAVTWFLKAAEQDFAQAQLNLGVMYFKGQGVPKDGAEVVKWITLAAAKGLAEAQYRLGTMYDKGMIFRADKIEAVRWYDKASKQGHEKSTARLAALAAAPLAANAPAAETDIDGPKPLAEIAPGPAAEFAADPAVEMAPGPAAEVTPGPAAAKIPATRTWRVQLASFRAPADAEVAWRRLSARHPELLAGLTAETVEADLGPERGIYHRLIAGPLDSRAAARALCRDIKQRTPRQGCLTLSR